MAIEPRAAALQLSGSPPPPPPATPPPHISTPIWFISHHASGCSVACNRAAAHETGADGNALADCDAALEMDSEYAMRRSHTRKNVTFRIGTPRRSYDDAPECLRTPERFDEAAGAYQQLLEKDSRRARKEVKRKLVEVKKQANDGRQEGIGIRF